MSGGGDTKPIKIVINPLEFEHKRYFLELLEKYPNQTLESGGYYQFEIELPNKTKQAVAVQLTHTLVPYKRKARDDNPDAEKETRYAVVGETHDKLVGKGYQGKVKKIEHTLVLIDKDTIIIKSKNAKPRVAKFFEDKYTALAERQSLLKHAGLFHSKQVPEKSKVAVSRYFPGMNLADYMKQKSDPKKPSPAFSDLNLTDKMEIIKNLLEALKSFHANGQVHRDLRRENIVINPKTKSVTIVDLGYARDIDAGDDYFRSKKAECTPMEAVAGNFSTKSDIYAAGVVAWDMLFGNEVTLERIIENRDGKRVMTVDELFPPDSKHSNESEEDKQRCVELLNGMLAANPRDRLEVSQCIASVDALISRLTAPEPSSSPRMGK